MSALSVHIRVLRAEADVLSDVALASANDLGSRDILEALALAKRNAASTLEDEERALEERLSA